MSESHAMEIDGKKFFIYEIRVAGSFIMGLDARPLPEIRKAWVAAWRAHASAVYALSAKSTKANIKNIRAAKLDEPSFGADDDPETTPVPQWSPTADEMLTLNGVDQLDGRGSVSILANKIVGIAYREDRKKP
jgi:hypothetical protein